MRFDSWWAFILILLIAACSSADEPTSTTTPQPTATFTPPTPTAIAPTAIERFRTVEPTLTPTPQSAAVPTPETSTVSEQETCPAFVEDALALVESSCGETGRNQVCYGNAQLIAEFQSDSEANQFEAPGDTAEFVDLQSLELSALNIDTGEWGVAIMRLQANLPDALPGENVTFLLFGDVQLENTGESDGVQSFYLQTAIGDAACREAPESGVLVQTPRGVDEVTFQINGVNVALASTAYLQAQPGGMMTVSVIEGQAELTAQGEVQVVRAGFQSEIELDADLNAIAPPDEPEPYETSHLVRLPINNLTRPIEISSVADYADFALDAEGWRTDDIGPTHRRPAQDTPAAICIDDGTFIAPQTWLGDRSDLLGEVFDVLLEIPDAETLPSIVLLSDDDSVTFTPDDVTRSVLQLSVALNSAAGWVLSSDEAAADDDIRDVLENLTGIQIQVGEQSACLVEVQFRQLLQSVTPYERQETTPPSPTPAPIGSVQEFNINLNVTVSENSPEDGAGLLEEPGSTDFYTLTLTEETLIYFDPLNSSSNEIEWLAFSPSGQILFNNMILADWNDPGSAVLPAGDVTIIVRGINNATGSYAFLVYEITDAQTFNIEIGERVDMGTPAEGAGEIAQPGETDEYTFEAEAGDEVYFAIVVNEIDSDGTGIWTVTAPSGDVLFENEGTWVGNDPGAFTLDETGTYTITVQSEDERYATYAFRLWYVQEPERFEINIGDTVTTDDPGEGAGVLDQPGARDIFIFEVEEMTEVTFEALSTDDTGSMLWEIRDPNGELLFETDGLWFGNHKGPFTLQPGTYTITVFADFDEFGEYSFAIQPS